VTDMADELNKLVVAKGHDKLDELVVAKGRDELNELVVAKGRIVAKGRAKDHVVAKGHDELDKLVVAEGCVICRVFRISVFDGCNNQLEHSRRLVTKG
jgi:hypothetical protein